MTNPRGPKRKPPAKHPEFVFGAGKPKPEIKVETKRPILPKLEKTFSTLGKNRGHIRIGPENNPTNLLNMWVIEHPRTRIHPAERVLEFSIDNLNDVRSTKLLVRAAIMIARRQKLDALQLTYDEKNSFLHGLLTQAGFAHHSENLGDRTRDNTVHIYMMKIRNQK